MAAAHAATYHIEAENATRTSDLVVATDVPGYSGTGFVNPFGAATSKVTATFTNVAAGTYQVRFHYHAYGAQQNFVSIDGGAAQDVPWPKTQGIGTGWSDVVLSGVQLGAGTHTVAVSKGWGYIDLDYIELVSGGTTTLTGEAETGTVSGTGISAKYDDPNAGGGGYVGNFTANGDTLTVRIPGVSAGSFDVAIRYRAWGTQQNNVQINGGTIQNKVFPGQNNAWMDLVLPGVALVNGTNTFVISKDWGYMDVDSIKVTTAGAAVTPITLRAPNDPNPDLLQVGNANYAYWIEDGVWGPGQLTRGTYTGLTGSQYETSYGRSQTVGPNGEVAWRSAWKWPTGTTEVKAYPSAVFGAKPGWYNTWRTPGGHEIRLLDETYSQIYPSGPTPGTFLPMTANGALPPIYSSSTFTHLTPPTGRGHLSYDIWLQSSPQQVNGFTAPPISHEIMIPLNYWGNYGAHNGGRNPGWYSHDVTLEGLLWHVYFVRNFAGGWTFVVFEPDASLSENTARTLNLSTFINYLKTRTDSNGQLWANGTESLVSVELGVEPVEGVGDMQISNFRVWKP
ncbi:CBM35 domain-containing protein [Ramlibacter sp.]|uniref:CBM35 domain-containing protein n=1 Tax=Ramlibacter sp. TaxID=1917967 RepID=UPI0017F99FB2|nr:CBM35 domain-containing protein [Ramlibacter sp.]MBA2675203.1 hypothetical protein [Ramlibacter sp.]